MENSNDHNLEVFPVTEIRFKGPFTKVVTSQLKVKNIGKKTLCYKVKTTAPKMYCVRPNSGLIETGKEVDVSVMLQPFDYCPSDKVRHKFLIQSVVADESNLENFEHLWKTIDRDMIKEVKLKCGFDQEQTAGDLILEDKIEASKSVLSHEQPGLELTVEQLKKQLHELKNENCKLKSEESRLRKIALQDTSDGSMGPMAVETSRNELTNLLFIVLCFIAFFVGLVLAKFIF